MELCDSKIKKLFSTFSNGIPYISGNGTLHFSVQVQKVKKVHPEKISYAPILKNFLYFLKRKLFLYFSKEKPRKNVL